MRYLFVGGLHRSGTSLAARMIAAIDGVAAIRNAPVPENEGVYLQGAIPHTAQHGLPMHFATDPAQHHVEGGTYDTLQTRQRLDHDWAPWFTPEAAPWRIEKSPVNLTRTRLYQQLFPLSQFIILVRHPQAVAGAVAKWRDISEEEALDHWIAAHRQLLEDLPYLHAAMVVRYEDLVARPQAWAKAFAAFLDRPADTLLPETIRDGNTDYSGGALSDGHRAALRDWGYDERLGVTPVPPLIRHPLRAVREATEAAVAAPPLGEGSAPPLR